MSKSKNNLYNACYRNPNCSMHKNINPPPNSIYNLNSIYTIVPEKKSANPTNIIQSLGYDNSSMVIEEPDSFDQTQDILPVQRPETTRISNRDGPNYSIQNSSQNATQNYFNTNQKRIFTQSGLSSGNLEQPDYNTQNYFTDKYSDSFKNNNIGSNNIQNTNTNRDIRNNNLLNASFSNIKNDNIKNNNALSDSLNNNYNNNYIYNENDNLITNVSQNLNSSQIIFPDTTMNVISIKKQNDSRVENENENTNLQEQINTDIKRDKPNVDNENSANINLNNNEINNIDENQNIQNPSFGQNEGENINNNTSFQNQISSPNDDKKEIQVNKSTEQNQNIREKININNRNINNENNLINIVSPENNVNNILNIHNRNLNNINNINVESQNFIQNEENKDNSINQSQIKSNQNEIINNINNNDNLNNLNKNINLRNNIIQDNSNPSSNPNLNGPELVKAKEQEEERKKKAFIEKYIPIENMNEFNDYFNSKFQDNSIKTKNMNQINEVVTDYVGIMKKRERENNQFIQQNIIDKGYNVNEFLNFLYQTTSKKSLLLINLEDVKKVATEYINNASKQNKYILPNKKKVIRIKKPGNEAEINKDKKPENKDEDKNNLEKKEDEIVEIEIDKDEKKYDDFQTRKLIPVEMSNFARTRINKNALFDYLNSFTDPVLFRNFLDKRTIKNILHTFRNQRYTKEIDSFFKKDKDIFPFFPSTEIEKRRSSFQRNVDKTDLLKIKNDHFKLFEYYMNQVNLDYYNEYLKRILILEEARQRKSKKLEEEYQMMLANLENIAKK